MKTHILISYQLVTPAWGKDIYNESIFSLFLSCPQFYNQLRNVYILASCIFKGRKQENKQNADPEATAINSNIMNYP